MATVRGNNEVVIQMIRDEFSRMRAHLFEAAEAAGWPSRQEKGWKGVIRTITYDSQSSIEAALRGTQRNGGTMVEPGITSAHVQAAREAQYGQEVAPAPDAEAQVQVETQEEEEASKEENTEVS